MDTSTYRVWLSTDRVYSVNTGNVSMKSPLDSQAKDSSPERPGYTGTGNVGEPATSAGGLATGGKVQFSKGNNMCVMNKHCWVRLWTEKKVLLYTPTK